MEPKKFTQYGKFSLLVLIPMIILFAGWWMKYEFFTNHGAMISLYISIILFIILLLFYKLTIFVDDQRISFRMGIGLIRRSFLIADIKSCTPVSNYFLTGFGIRLIHNGWLYNVSGFKAIELQFHNKKSVIRIGTDRPEEICALIHKSKEVDTFEESSVDLARKRLTPRLIFMFALIALILVFVISVKMERTVVVKDDVLKIKGFYGVTIPLANITEVDTLSLPPIINRKTNGYQDIRNLVGYFRLGDDTKARLLIKTGHPPYLRILSKNQVPVYLNFSDRQRTVDLYKKLTTR